MSSCCCTRQAATSSQRFARSARAASSTHRFPTATPCVPDRFHLPGPVGKDERNGDVLGGNSQFHEGGEAKGNRCEPGEQRNGADREQHTRPLGGQRVV